MSVLEYSEIPSHLVGVKNDDGGLRFSSGNVCNHVVSLDFARRIAVAGALPYVALLSLFIRSNMNLCIMSFINDSLRLSADNLDITGA